MVESVLGERGCVCASGKSVSLAYSYLIVCHMGILSQSVGKKTLTKVIQYIKPAAIWKVIRSNPLS